MNTLIRKEARMLLPAWIAALIASIAPVCLLYDSSAAWIFSNIGFSIGAMMIGLSSIGQEVSFGTFSNLLAQPCQRKYLWRAKLGLSALALLIVLLAFRLAWFIRVQPLPTLLQDGSSREIFQVSGLIALLALSGGFWTTLLFRQIASAFWITLVTPFMIFMVYAYFWRHFTHRALETTLVVYALAGLVWARHQFLHAQDVGWTGGNISLPGLSRWISRAPAKAQRSHALVALFRKELQFQQVTLVLAAGVLLLHIIAIIRAKMVGSSHEETTAVISIGLWLMWSVAVPGVAGGMAVAEERKLGTLESQLCLPSRCWIPFAVKLGTVLLVTIIFGAIIPSILSSMDGGNGLAATKDFTLPKEVFIVSLFVAAVSFYASSLTRNMLQAIGAAIVLPMLAGGLMKTLWIHDNLIGWPVNEVLMTFIGLPLLGMTIIWVSYKNYQRWQIGWPVLLADTGWFAAVWVVSVILTLTIYHRPWEKFLSLEPKHGVARLNGSARSGIWTTADSREIMALLPDGRLWMAPLSLQQKSHFDWFWRRKEIWNEASPGKGSFASQSNWVSIAPIMNGAVGIQADGTLWRVRAAPGAQTSGADFTMEQMGNDSDWKTVASGANHFLALKDDGSLWGWGDNRGGELGRTPKVVTNQPVRIGHDSDWISIFPSRAASIAIKKDGTMWAWGNYFSNNRFEIHHEPVRLNLQGTNWVALSFMYSTPVALRSDGILAAEGNRDFLGDSWLKPGLGKLRDISLPLAAIKQDGVLLTAIQLQNIVDLIAPSKYFDWIAVTSSPVVHGQIFALAADGTISSWGGRRPHFGPIQLKPSRRPVFSLNVLDR